MSHILSCLTDSPSARRVLRATALSKRALEEPVRLVHFGELGEDGRGRLNALIAEEVGPDCTLEVDESAGRVGDAIAQRARDTGADLIIMGALSREKVVRDLVGSTARLVARRAPCSVMLVSTIGRDPLHWSRFIVGIEATAAAQRLANTALRLAQQAGKDSEVCFALEYRGLGRHAAPPREFSKAAHSGELAQEQYQLSSFIDELDLRNVKSRAVALAGRPGQEIARYAEDTQADVVGVVAPNRAMGFLDRLLSHPIILMLDKLPCTVLLFRSSGGTA